MVHNINEDLHVTGTIVIKKADGTKIIELGPNGNLVAGGGGLDGDLILRDKNGKDLVYLRAEEQDLLFKKADGTEVLKLSARWGNLRMGGNGQDGDVLLFPPTASDISKTDQASIWLDAQYGNLALGGNGRDGDILLFPAGATISTTDASNATIHLDGDVGDIKLQNADCAEEFDVADLEEVDPGTVMVIDEGGDIRQSTTAYDKKVAGVVSGAGNLKPGLVLDKKDEATNRIPLALMGKVYCKVDAEYAAIEVGDLLTTSPTPGHAMKATDPLKAFGTIIGKALGSLEAGKGLIPILVALQ